MVFVPSIVSILNEYFKFLFTLDFCSVKLHCQLVSCFFVFLKGSSFRPIMKKIGESDVDVNPIV